MSQTKMTLEGVIRDSGQTWMLEWIPPRAGAVAHVADLIRRTAQRARERLGEEAPEISEEAIVREYGTNPEKIRAFLQALGSIGSVDMLVMVWCVLEGMEIAEVWMEYRQQESFYLRVRLSSPHGMPDATYESRDIDDAAVLRHFGIMKMGNQPVLDGFYSLRLEDN